uniref:Uncharacterized protein n=1 Tax=Meloidogyne javanica TaxID=6303 RepID=A0A915LTY9_MELJA
MIEMSGRLPSFIESSKEMTEYPKIKQAPLIPHKTNKQAEMKPIPLDVEKKNIGYYEQLKPSIIEDKTKSEEEEILEEALLIDNLPETFKQTEMDLIPLEVENKNVGYYENLPSLTVQEKKPEEPLLETYKSTELDKSKIDQFVNVYSSGRSDEISTSTKMEEHKIEESFPIQETKIQTELEDLKPIEDLLVDSKPFINFTNVISELPKESINTFVNVYSSGRSDEVSTSKMEEQKIEVPSTYQVLETKRQLDIDSVPMKVEKKSYGDQLFASHEKETKPEPSERIKEASLISHIFEAFKQEELDLTPMEIEKKNIGYYEHKIPSIIEEEKLEGPKELIQEEAEDLEFPSFKQTEIPPSIVQENKPEELSFETCKSAELDKSKIDQCVNIYSSGCSDEIREAPTSEASSNVLETTKQSEMNLTPLDVEKKHVGYYEQSIPLIIEEGKEEKLEGPKELIQKEAKASEFHLFTEQTEMSKPSLEATEFLLEAEPFEETKTVLEPKEEEHLEAKQQQKQNELPFKPLEIEKKLVGYQENLLPLKTEETKPEALEEKKKDSEVEHKGLCLGDFIEEGKKEMRKKKKVKKGKGRREEEKKEEIKELEELEEFQQKKSEKEIGRQNVIGNEEIKETGKVGEEEEMTEYPKPEEENVSYEITEKHPEMKPKPLQVEKRNMGYYEDLPPPSIVQETNPEGLLFETSKYADLDKSQIDQFINIYSFGRSDEIITSTKIEEHKIKVPYISQVFETKRQSDINSVPMEVEKKNVEYYEQLIPSIFGTSWTEASEKIFEKASLIGNISEAFKQPELAPTPLDVEKKNVGYPEASVVQESQFKEKEGKFEQETQTKNYEEIKRVEYPAKSTPAFLEEEEKSLEHPGLCLEPDYDIEAAAEMFAAAFPNREPKDVLREHGITDLELVLDEESEEEEYEIESLPGSIIYPDGETPESPVPDDPRQSDRVSRSSQELDDRSRWRRVLRTALPLQVN